MSNIDEKTVAGFGDEWARFDQSGTTSEELETIFEQYFGIFPWKTLPDDAIGADFGCGSGRWARLVAPRVGHLLLVDASRAALDVARKNLGAQSNVSFHEAPLDRAPIDDGTLDFAYSLGVLHHIPDTQAAMTACAMKLKSGAPFLVYLYYRFDNRPAWYQRVWQASELARGVVSKLPPTLKHLVTDAVAASVYLPLAKLSRYAEQLGANVERIPLSYYRDRSFYVMRNDALDRFGTRLEQRFTRAEIDTMMQSAGLTDVRFSGAAPFWVAVGTKR